MSEKQVKIGVEFKKKSGVKKCPSYHIASDTLHFILDIIANAPSYNLLKKYYKLGLDRL